VKARHGQGGTKRQLDPAAMLAERARLHALPRSPERSAAFARLNRQFYRLQFRSPFKDEGETHA
jgi:hypothetical protein